MNSERLLKLADFLETIPESSFDMGAWVSENATGPFSPQAPGSCGFAGCALGWAAHAKLFPELRLKKRGGGWQSFRFNRKISGGTEAACRTFGLVKEQADYLFEIHEYDLSFDISTEQVSRRIRAFVKSGGKLP